MNFVCTVFEQGDEILTLLSVEKPMGESNPIPGPVEAGLTSDWCII